jgi:hypothetical protein
MLNTVLQTSLLVQKVRMLAREMLVYLVLRSWRFKKECALFSRQPYSLEVLCLGAVNWRHRPKIVDSKPPVKTNTGRGTVLINASSLSSDNRRTNDSLYGLASRLMFFAPNWFCLFYYGGFHEDTVGLVGFRSGSLLNLDQMLTAFHYRSVIRNRSVVWDCLAAGCYKTVHLVFIIFWSIAWIISYAHGFVVRTNDRKLVPLYRIRFWKNKNILVVSLHRFRVCTEKR